MNEQVLLTWYPMKEEGAGEEEQRLMMQGAGIQPRDQVHQRSKDAPEDAGAWTHPRRIRGGCSLGPSLHALQEAVSAAVGLAAGCASCFQRRVVLVGQLMRKPPC